MRLRGPPRRTRIGAVRIRDNPASKTFVNLHTKFMEIFLKSKQTAMTHESESII